MPPGLPTNILAFGVYVATQQLLIFPLLARALSGDDLAAAILFVSVHAVASNALGEELANARVSHLTQIDENAGIRGTKPLLAVTLTVTAFGSAIWVAFGQLSTPSAQMVSICLVLGVLRAYLLAELRIAAYFSSILGSNIAYLFGSALGLLLFANGWSPYIVFLFGELFALGLVALRIFPIRSKTALTGSSSSSKRLVVTYVQFAVISGLMNTIVYLDRLVAVPLIGAAALAVYFAVSSWAKMVSMMANPVSGVLLSLMSRTHSSEKLRVVTKFLKSIPAIVAVALVLALAASWLGVILLYPQFRNEASNLYFPAALAAALGIVPPLSRPILIRFYRPVAQLIVHVVHAIALVIFLVAGSRFGVAGFAWAVASARLVQVTTCAVVLRLGASDATEPL